MNTDRSINTEERENEREREDSWTSTHNVWKWRIRWFRVFWLLDFQDLFADCFPPVRLSCVNLIPLMGSIRLTKYEYYFGSYVSERFRGCIKFASSYFCWSKSSFHSLNIINIFIKDFTDIILKKIFSAICRLVYFKFQLSLHRHHE